MERPGLELAPRWDAGTVGGGFTAMPPGASPRSGDLDLRPVVAAPLPELPVTSVAFLPSQLDLDLPSAVAHP